MAAIEKSLDARQCALPTVTLSAKILEIGEPSEPSLTVRGAVGDGEAVVEFSVQAETSIQIRYPAGALDDSVMAATPIDGAESVGQIIKPLRFRGLLTLDRYDRPTGGELTRITAVDDDPGFLQWDAFDLLQRPEALRLPVIPPDFYKNLMPTLDIYKNLLPKFPTELYKNLGIVPDKSQPSSTPAAAPRDDPESSREGSEETDDAQADSTDDAQADAGDEEANPGDEAPNGDS